MLTPKTRRAGSMRWRTPDVEIFFQSTREGEGFEVDIHNLRLQDKKNLVERLIKIVEENNEKFLLKLKNRMDR
ncbi:Pleiotropic drug resistance protein 1 [Vitis vinifera]|uniref:Pleiotropic drug resistance protein 1 n=1 Tax=Vitis vinifera TaxID=29760 RepID=A0A438GZJ3_VITVI|nr:Pleiotropic drug resistance protein 1 [Vitis vinifera]